MTSSDPAARDELVAAYLDNEATLAERAQVEADPELVARVDIMRQMAELVAEPVVPPPAHVRDRHIAEALAVSATATNVTSLGARRRWSPDYTRVLSAAAVILVVLFAGSLLLLNNSDDDDSVASSPVAADSAAQPVDGGDDDVANTTEAPADEAAAAAEEPPAEVSGGQETLELGDDEEMADSQAEPAAAAPEEDAALEAELTTGSDDPSGLAASGYVASGEFADTAALADSLSDFADSDVSLADAAIARAGLGPVCLETLSLLVGDQQEALLVGDAIVGGVAVEWVIADTPEGPRLTIVDTATCGIFDDVAL